MATDGANNVSLFREVEALDHYWHQPYKLYQPLKYILRHLRLRNGAAEADKTADVQTIEKVAQWYASKYNYLFKGNESYLKFALIGLCGCIFFNNEKFYTTGESCFESFIKRLKSFKVCPGEDNIDITNFCEQYLLYEKDFNRGMKNIDKVLSAHADKKMRSYGRCLQKKGDFLFHFEKYDQAKNIYQECWTNPHLSEDEVEQAMILYRLAQCYREVGDYEAAIPIYQKVRDCTKDKLYQVELGCLLYSCQCYQALKKYSEVKFYLDLYEQRLKILGKKIDNSKKYIQMNEVYQEVRDNLKEMKSELMEQDFNEKCKEASSFFAKGEYKFKKRKYQKALDAFTKSLDIKLEIYENEVPKLEYFDILKKQEKCFSMLKEYAKAASWNEKLSKLVDSKKEQSMYMMNAGMNFNQAGLFPEARSCFKKALVDLEDNAFDPYECIILIELTYYQERKYDKAMTIIRINKVFREKLYGLFRDLIYGKLLFTLFDNGMKKYHSFQRIHYFILEMSSLRLKS